MPPKVALAVCCLFIGWAYFRDRKLQGPVSGALWIPVLWIAILGSRPVSAWLGIGGSMELAEDYIEGSPVDRNCFLVLLIAGIYVLKKRKLNWSVFVSNNRWLFAFYLFFGFSIVWSDFPFVAFKRWIKDLGNVVMVLVILTDPNPVQALRSVLTRAAYFLVPFSVLFIKYYPDLGRAYDRWSGRTYYQGVTVGKNLLGGMLLIVTLFVVWDVIQMLRKKSKKQTVLLLNRGIVLAMAAWLLIIADSVTSLFCCLIGLCGLITLNLPFFRRRLNSLMVYTGVGAVCLLILSSLVDIRSGAFGAFGRDTTLTGRTEIWSAVLGEKTNPIIGTGFYSFWLGTRADKLSEQYSFRLTQAHNGYLEMYLDGGVIGLGLLLGMLLSTGLRIKRELLIDPDMASMRLVFWLIILVNNWSEASFCRLSLVWFAMVIMIVRYPRPGGAGARRKKSVPAGTSFPQPEPAPAAEQPEEALKHGEPRPSGPMGEAQDSFRVSNWLGRLSSLPIRA
jgi:O-antigen ligase